MNPLVPTPVDVVYGVLAAASFVLTVVALVVVWREEVEDRDISRAIFLSILVLLVPFVGAIATIVNVRKHKTFHSES